ncbi:MULTISPECIES: sugar ABC transporter ATP-binding protein [Streptomyces]|jgi:ribose transport system ATP-binding protein|uniref:Sugar ABC transporter ATP-binding protein n=1 Tax=Streptomyces spinosisporus TaxID=2927582 RepID=A0ABS9XUN5_9ACTN|nr:MULTISPECIES: sugar ABC transporter ATP-binding protein [Streptomyces]MCI3245765.1 sugar ABC transporter ATP-binding protein [Streptomyces spinosisporus]WUB33454.1 sugar ABC transporter ATP-binding protein [Streptomyces sp. NBC_00588]
MSEVLLECREIVKVFPGVRALDGVGLRLTAGSVHALLGENGAGKSTLIKVLTGVHPPDAGHLTWRGEQVHLRTPLEATRTGIGVVHQERNLIPGFSVAENITLQNPPSRHGLVDRQAMNAPALRCLEELGLDLDPHRLVRELSVAQQQLVEIAKALHTQSEVLLLDEPTASLSPQEAENLFQVVRRLTARNTCVVFVSHKLEEVFAISDTVTVLRDGRSVLESAPLADHTHDDIVNLMVGRAHTAAKMLPRTPEPTSVPVLALDGICTARGHQDVSLAVRPGEIVGLYGLVGAGRSELVKAVLGLDRVTGGEIRVDGTPARIASPRQALHEFGIGYLTENRKEEGVFLEQPIHRNITVTVWKKLARALGVVSSAEERSVAQNLVERLGIRASGLDQNAGELSGGNQQKVSLAKWLAADTRLLIVDEPTVGVDVRTKHVFHELLWELARTGLPILLISSDLTEVITLADRVLVMADHRIRGEVGNDHHYERMSGRIIRLIHDRAPSAVSAQQDAK